MTSSFPLTELRDPRQPLLVLGGPLHGKMYAADGYHFEAYEAEPMKAAYDKDPPPNIKTHSHVYFQA